VPDPSIDSGKEERSEPWLTWLRRLGKAIDNAKNSSAELSADPS
jgi:hypothetical protein